VRFFLDPCHEYEVLAQKKGLPDVKRKVKAPCTNREEDAAVKLGTGIAPLKGVLVKLVATDEQTGAPVPNAKIRLINKTENTEIELLADEKGEYETVLKENTEVLVSTTRVGYFATSKSKATFKVSKGDKNVVKNLKLLKLTEGGIIALEGIFYDLNKTEIRPDAAKVLDYVYDVLIENPGMVIEMGSHTDARGSDDANLKLSDGRAVAAAQYIIGKGIPAERITGKGYGETRLNNKCGNGVKCTEAQHQENRRTEIRIVEFD
jgi:outer membrane protein OmpA-like peptidoglycan-associated protein